VLERQLAELQSQDPNLTTDASGADSVAQQLEAAKAELARLEMRNTPDHPDVRMQQRKVRDLEAKAEAEAKRSESAGTPKEARSPAEINRRKRIQDLQDQMADIDQQLAANEQQQQQLRAEVSTYESRLSALPTRESELVELTRDYQTLLNSYHGLSAKREESALSANLERKNVGEQFRVLDPPRVPERPFSPDRVNLQMTGTAAGLIVGLALVGFLEYRDGSFKTEAEVFRVLTLPVLAVIPVVVPPAETGSRRKRHAWLIAALSGGFALVVAAAIWFWRRP
jgi:uncharacterized protein involved in exopolysaccharide biosynthesis